MVMLGFGYIRAWCVVDREHDLIAQARRIGDLLQGRTHSP